MQKRNLNQLYKIFVVVFVLTSFTGLFAGCSSKNVDEAKNETKKLITSTTTIHSSEQVNDSDSSADSAASSSSSAVSLQEASVDPFSDLGSEDLVAVVISEDKKMIMNAVTNGEVLSIETVAEEINAHESEAAGSSERFSADNLVFNDVVLSTDNNMIAIGASSGASPDISSYTVLYDNSEVDTSLLTSPARPISFSPNGRRLAARVFISGCKFDNAVFEVGAGRKIAAISDRDCGKVSNILGWISDDELKYEVIVKKTGQRSLWKFDIRSSKSIALQEQN